MNKTDAGLLIDLLEEDGYTLIDNPYSKWARLEEHDSFVIDKDRGYFYWNSKNIYGDAYIYLTKIRGLSPSIAKDTLKNRPKYYGEFVHIVKENEDITIYPKLVELFWEAGREGPKRKYWYKRLLTDSTIDRFRLGYHRGWNTVPVYDDGILKNIQLRRDEPEKATIPFWKGIRPALFNSAILAYTDTVFITEGIVDAILLTQERLPAISKNIGAEYWNDSWFSKFIECKTINVVFDNDDAGRNGAKRIAKSLGMYRTKIYTFDGFPNKYDIGKFFEDGNNANDFVKLVKDRSLYLFELE